MELCEWESYWHLYLLCCGQWGPPQPGRNSEQFACMDQTPHVQVPAYPHAVLLVYFFNTPINLAVMAKRSRSQVTFHHSLLENATDTFIENFSAWCFILKSSSHSRTKFWGGSLDCHSFSRWQGPGYFMLKAEENVMQCGQWETSCIGRAKTEDGSILLSLRPNRVPCKVRGCWEVILQLPD